MSFVTFSLCYTSLFPAFVALTRTSAIMLNKRDRSGPDLRSRVLSVLVLNVVFTAPFVRLPLPLIPDLPGFFYDGFLKIAFSVCY